MRWQQAAAIVGFSGFPLVGLIEADLDNLGMGGKKLGDVQGPGHVIHLCLRPHLRRGNKSPNSPVPIVVGTIGAKPLLK